MKNNIRDYATAAFYFYSINGKSYDKYRQKLYKEALDNIKQKENSTKSTGISKPVESATIKADEYIESKRAELFDILSVERTLAMISKLKSGGDIIKAIEIVYFPFEGIKRGDIRDRVRIAESTIPASDRCIYKWLRIAREIFAMDRGLRYSK